MRKTERCKAGALRYCCLLLCAVAAAQTPTVDQSLNMKSVQGAEISPDGRYVAYMVQQTNWEENEFAQQIWIYMLSTGEHYQLTSGKKSSQSPKWSPDSKRIAFDAARDPDLSSSGTSQIYVVNVADKFVKKLADGSGPNRRPIWSPDGKQIAYSTANGEKFYMYANSRIAAVPADGGT